MPRSSATKKSKKQTEAYHHGDLRNVLIDTGSKLLEKEGAEKLSLRDLAREAGVSHTAPYRHFEDKQELLQALARKGFEELAQGMMTAGKSHKDPIKQLHAAGTAYIKLAIEHPERTRLMFGGMLDPDCFPQDFVEIATNAFAGLVVILEGGQKAGVFVPGDPELLALSAWSLVHGFSMLFTGKQLRVETFDDPQMDVMREGVLRSIQLGLAVRKK
jgi:AcrR family transcriptional regulator